MLLLERLERRDCPASITIADETVDEGTTASSIAQFTVSLSEPCSAVVTLNWKTVDGTATVADKDYRSALGTIRFLPGQTSRVISVAVMADSRVEEDETFSIELSAPVGATLAKATATGTIRNDDRTTPVVPQITVADTRLPEGNVGRKDAVFVVTLSAETTVPVTVTYATVDGSATAADSDYVPTTSRLTFAPGQTRKFVGVGVLGDTRVENDEVFSLVLTSPINATLGKSTGAATILNDDIRPLPPPVISVMGGSVIEGNSGDEPTINFRLTLTGVASSVVTVNYETVDGTATIANNDYRRAKGTLAFQPGETTKTIPVAVIGDTTSESNESFSLVLTSATGAMIALSTSSASATIVDDDTPPAIRVSDVTVAEGNSGTQLATFVITLSRPTAEPVTVNYATRDGSATVADSDYAATSGVLTFAPGETSKTVAVGVLGDTIAESTETFLLVLSMPTHATIAEGVGVATIVNDDIGDVPGFQITVDYLGTVRQSIKDACDWAARRWSQVITGDLPGVWDAGIFTDDLRIVVQEGLLGGGNAPGGALANAGPTDFRSGTAGLPWRAEAGVDPYDAGNAQLRNILLHEFGHALGFGTFAGFSRFMVGSGFTGPNAVSEYRSIFANSATSVPLETGGGQGTAGGHWSEAVFRTELMTGYSERAGVAMPLSRITVAAMKDLGYQINYDAADAYVRPIVAAVGAPLAATVGPPPSTPPASDGMAPLRGSRNSLMNHSVLTPAAIPPATPATFQTGPGRAPQAAARQSSHPTGATLARWQIFAAIQPD